MKLWSKWHIVGNKTYYVKKKKKIKCTLVQAVQPTGGVGIYLLFLDHDTRRGGEGSASCPSRSLSPGKTRYPSYRRLGGPQCRSGQVRKFSPPQGFDPRTVQPVASPYIDWDIWPTMDAVNAPDVRGAIHADGNMAGSTTTPFYQQPNHSLNMTIHTLYLM